MRRFFLFATMTLGAIALQAAPVSPDQALQRVRQDSRARIKSSGAGYKLLYTQKAESIDAVYVFGADGDGFIVAPADDNAPALLGYGDTKIFDQNGRMAPAFEEWLSQLGRQIEYASTHDSGLKAARINRPEREPIGVLCKTRWNQSAPFNDNCPTQGGVTCVTGCVATAMSQVMKYHNWPEVGEGEVNYKWSSKTLKINFARTLFKWDDMLDIYNSSSSSDACKAVATLMQATGYSVKMNYKPNGSGAMSYNIAPALGQYFKYDKSLRFLHRDNYSLADWEDIIYTSLKTYGPVIYDGQSGIGGHSFVCDGYQSDGYFHFNWGWGGLSDGYFLLDALDPLHQGIGGADGGFDYMQDIICDIRPDTTGDSTWSYSMSSSDNCNMYSDVYEGENAIFIESPFYNWGPGTITDAYIGFQYTNIDDPGAEPYLQIEKLNDDLVMTHGIGSFGMEYPQLPDGRYEVTPVYGSGDGEPRPVLFPVYGTAKSIFTVNGSDMSFVSEVVETPDFLDMEVDSQINKNSPVNIKGQLQNPNETPYLCFLSAVFMDTSDSKLMAYSLPRVYDLDAGETTDVDLTTNVESLSSLKDGYYNLRMGQLLMTTGYVYFINDPTEVYVGGLGAVENLIENEMTGTVDIYDMSGARVASLEAGHPLPDLSPGIYILKSTSATRKVIIK